MITIDIVFIPTSILSLLSLLAMFGYFIYGFNIDKSQTLYLFIIFFLVSTLYTILAIKLKLWRVVAHRSQLKNKNEYIDKIDTLINKTGHTVSQLHPSGIVEIEDQKYDAITNMGYISADKGIIVTGRSGSQIIVKINK